MGALIVSRLPRNPIGWLFCGVGLLYAIRRFAAGVRRVHPVRKYRFSPGGLRGLARFVAGVYGAGPRGSVPDAAVPRWPIAVSPMANRGRASDLRSRVGRALRRVRAVRWEPVRRRGRHRRPTHHLRALRGILFTRHDAAVGEQSRRAFLAHTPVAPRAGRRTSAAHVVPVRCRPRGCRPVRGNTRVHRLPFHDGLALQHDTRAVALALVLHRTCTTYPSSPCSCCRSSPTSPSRGMGYTT